LVTLDRLADYGQRVVDLLAVVGAVIDGQFQQRLALPCRGDDALDLLGWKYGRAVERERLGLGLFQLDRNVVASAFGHAVDGARLGLIRARVDLESVAL